MARCIQEQIRCKAMHLSDVQITTGVKKPGAMAGFFYANCSTLQGNPDARTDCCIAIDVLDIIRANTDILGHLQIGAPAKRSFLLVATG